MGEFRIGMGGPNARAQHVYPESRQAAALGLFARNFASGPKNTTEISGGGIEIPWNAVGSPIKFTIAAGGIALSIPGDVTDSFAFGDVVGIVPSAPDLLPPVANTVGSAPVYSAGPNVTTFQLGAPIDTTTTAGFIADTTIGTVDVPITPRTTGRVLISGVVTFENGSGGPLLATVQVAINGTPLAVPFDLQASLGDGDSITIPFMAEIGLTIGETSYVEIIVTGDGIDLLGEDSILNIQEVSIETG